MSSGEQTTRLHISPLDETLLDAILHGRPAQEISFHSIPTFPENSYGFITLPSEDAQKIMKKLNGAILKGKRLRIQPARPQTWRYPVHDEEEASDCSNANNTTPTATAPSVSNNLANVPAKRRVTDNVLPGGLLPQERRIRRGWTEPIMASRMRKLAQPEGMKNAQRSKYTDKRECLFRVKIPPNKLSAVVGDGKRQKLKPKSKGESSLRDATVHEFSKTFKHPSFIRSGTSATDSSLTDLFDDAIGWLDRLGLVKEPMSENLRRYHPRETYDKPVLPLSSGEREISPNASPNDTQEDRVSSAVESDQSMTDQEVILQKRHSDASSYDSQKNQTSRIDDVARQDEMTTDGEAVPREECSNASPNYAQEDQTSPAVGGDQPMTDQEAVSQEKHSNASPNDAKENQASSAVEEACLDRSIIDQKAVPRERDSNASSNDVGNGETSQTMKDTCLKEAITDQEVSPEGLHSDPGVQHSDAVGLPDLRPTVIANERSNGDHEEGFKDEDPKNDYNDTKALGHNQTPSLIPIEPVLEDDFHHFETESETYSFSDSGDDDEDKGFTDDNQIGHNGYDGDDYANDDGNPSSATEEGVKSSTLQGS